MKSREEWWRRKLYNWLIGALFDALQEVPNRREREEQGKEALVEAAGRVVKDHPDVMCSLGNIKVGNKALDGSHFQIMLRPQLSDLVYNQGDIVRGPGGQLRVPIGSGCIHPQVWSAISGV